MPLNCTRLIKERLARALLRSYPQKILLFHPLPRLPPPLLHQPHIPNHHPPIDSLTHVVDGEQANLHGSQRFHFYAGLPTRLRADGERDRARATTNIYRKFKPSTLTNPVDQVERRWSRSGAEMEHHSSHHTPAISLRDGVVVCDSCLSARLSPQSITGVPPLPRPVPNDHYGGCNAARSDICMATVNGVRLSAVVYVRQWLSLSHDQWSGNHW